MLLPYTSSLTVCSRCLSPSAHIYTYIYIHIYIYKCICTSPFSFCDVLRRHTQVGCTRRTERTSHAGYMSAGWWPFWCIPHQINIVITTESFTLTAPIRLHTSEMTWVSLYTNRFLNPSTQLKQQRQLWQWISAIQVSGKRAKQKHMYQNRLPTAMYSPENQQTCHTMKENIHYCIMCTSAKTEHPIGWKYKIWTMRKQIYGFGQFPGSEKYHKTEHPIGWKYEIWTMRKPNKRDSV